MWKKIVLWIAAICAAVLALLAGRRRVKSPGADTGVVGNKGAEFEKKADEERQSAADRIRGAPARTVAEQFGGVCDAVVEGRNRFAERLKRELDEGGGSGLD